MRITKHEHAHLSIEKGGRRIVIDPGVFSPDAAVADVDAVVVTHEHEDHWTPEHLAALRALNPDVRIYGPASVAAAVDGIPVTEVGDGDIVTAGPFTLRFVGGPHATIHDALPATSNLGVVVDDVFYHPGDSYAPPGRDVELVAVPTSGPWHKLSESIDWLSGIRPPRMMNLHDELLSDVGRHVAVSYIEQFAAEWGGTFTVVGLRESIAV
jgi:L-ascorbate metabolism protein UlaG (beta-lactamase superfamily)